MVFFKDGHVSVETSSLFFIPCKPNNKATIVSTFVDEKKNDDIKCNQLDYYESNFSNYSCCLEKALQESLKYVGVN